jgi:hypothetical protein
VATTQDLLGRAVATILIFRSFNNQTKNGE